VETKASTKTVLLHAILVVQLAAVIAKESGRLAIRKGDGVYGQQIRTQRIGVKTLISNKIALLHAMPVKLKTIVHVFATFDESNPLVVGKRALVERW